MKRAILSVIFAVMLITAASLPAAAAKLAPRSSKEVSTSQKEKPTIKAIPDKRDGKASGALEQSTASKSWNEGYAQFLKTFEYDKFVMFDDNKHWGHYGVSGDVFVIKNIRFHDTDGDGVPEMIIDEGLPNSEWQIIGYKFADGKVTGAQEYSGQYDSSGKFVPAVIPGKELASFEVTNEAQMQSVISWLEKQI